jgi:hypothetical protein
MYNKGKCVLPCTITEILLEFRYLMYRRLCSALLDNLELHNFRVFVFTTDEPVFCTVQKPRVTQL